MKRALVGLAVVVAACGSSDNADGPTKQPTDLPVRRLPDGGTIDPNDPDGPDAAKPAIPTTGTIKGSVTRYDYKFDIATAKASAKVSVAVAAPGGDCLSIGCRTNDATDVSWNGAPAKSSNLASGQLAVCGPPSAPGTVDIMATIPEIPTQTLFGLDVGFSRQPDRAGGQFSYLLSWVGGCDRFGPCDPDPSRLSEMHFEITHPEGTVVLCPGTLTAGATLTKCDVSGTLAPTYSGFGLAADPMWARTAFTSAAGVDVVMYEVPGGTIASSIDKASFGAFLTWITGLLGPMPYGPELRFASGPTYWLGFEHPANIILNEHIADNGSAYGNTPQHVAMHETIHQWSGDRATIATTSDFVWKEAIAEYLAYVFEDEHRPASEAAASLAYWDSISLQSTHRPRPTDNPDVDAFYTDVYGPGPMVLFVQLETMLGRPAVLAGIKSFLASPGAKSVDELRAALATAGGKDLKAYFDAWVTGPGAPEWPTFDVTTSKAGSQLTVTVEQKNPSNVIYGCKLDVSIAGQIATVDFGVAPTAKTASTTITFNGTPSPITIDPKHRVISRAANPNQGFAKTPRQKVWIL